MFRAKDKLLPALLDAYAQICAAAGSPTRHLKILAESRAKIVAWQAENPTKTPDSEASRAWMEPADPA